MPTHTAVATLALSSTATPPPAPATSSQTTFVFRPGAQPEPNVYQDWGVMMSAVNQVAGPKWIQFDTRFAAAHVPAGLWDLDGVTLSSDGAFGDIGTLTLDDGARFEFGLMTIASAFIIANNSTQAPVEFTGGVGGVLNLYACSIESGGIGTFPFMKVDSTAGLCSILAYNNVVIGSGLAPALRVDGGATLTLTMFGNCLLASNATSGAGTLNCSFDGTCNIGGGQLAGLAKFPLANAVREPYTAASAPNWNGAPPANVAAALDRIAAHVGPIP